MPGNSTSTIIAPVFPPYGCKKLCLICPLSGSCHSVRRCLGFPSPAIATEYLSSVAGCMHNFSRRCPWQVAGDKTITSRYSITSLKRLHDPHCANLIGLSRDLSILLTVMEAGGGASSPGVREAPQRCRVCVLRAGAVPDKNLSHNIPYEIDSSL
jgi:hypothetical protein